jgi:hypothetical protein
LHVSKNISFGVIDVDTESGRIWINCPTCILRIQDINFNQPQEKFSMIDIKGNNAYMYPGDLPNKELGNFLETITMIILPLISEMNIENQQKFLDDLVIKIKEELQKCQS